MYNPARKSFQILTEIRILRMFKKNKSPKNQRTELTNQEFKQ